MVILTLNTFSGNFLFIRNEYTKYQLGYLRTLIGRDTLLNCNEQKQHVQKLYKLSY